MTECHHSVAKTYQETIKLIRKCRSNAKLLGITATPVRANDTATAKLLNRFEMLLERVAELSEEDYPGGKYK